MAVSSVHTQVKYLHKTHCNKLLFPTPVVKECLFLVRITTWSVSLPFVMPWREGLHSLCASGRRRFQRTSWNMSWSSASSPCPPPVWSHWSFTFIWCWTNSSVSSCSRWSSLVRLVRRWPETLTYLVTLRELANCTSRSADGRIKRQVSLFDRRWSLFNLLVCLQSINDWKKQ